MGAFKPLLPFGGRTVIETCVGNLVEAGVGEIVVVVGHRGDELRGRLAHLGVEFATNAEAESEMGVSVARGVERVSAGAESVLIALVDQPASGAEVVRRLVNEQRRTGARLVVPEWRGRGGHPVLIDLAYRDALLHLDPQRGLRALFDTHRDETLRVPVECPYVARDMDTWEDYRALHREVFGVEPPAAPPGES